jgi:hypothetical protein
MRCKQYTKGGRSLHSAESKDDSYSHLLLLVHLQLVHDEDWNDTKRPIRGTGQRRVAVERVHDNIRGDALAFAATELLPEERDRPALEGKDEEEVHAVELDSDQGGPKNDAMCSVNGNTQQEDADAALEEEVRSNVSRLASPPPLIQIVSLVDYAVDVVLHTFMPTGYFSSGMRYRRLPVPFWIPSSAEVQKTKKDTRVRTEK